MERLRQRLLENTELYPTPPQDPRFSTNVPVLTTFEKREHARAVHAPRIAGISGSVKDGATSICISNGYEDDKDDGDFIVYTGTGGQADSFVARGQQIRDQTFNHPDNGALYRSAETKRPVRVVRGPNPNSLYAPESGYRYDGLYTVEKAYISKGKSGYQICQYELRRLPNQPKIPTKGLV